MEIDRDSSKGKERILVWIMDRDKHEDSDSGLKIRNIEELRSRFRFIKERSDRADGRARWNWLRSRYAFIIHETDHARLDYLNILFSDIPGTWIADRAFQKLYFDTKLSHSWKVSYTIFLDWSGANSSNRRFQSQITDCSPRYFGYAIFYTDGREAKILGIELPSPGRNYGRAFLTAYAAAVEFLGLHGAVPLTSVNGKEGLKELDFMVSHF
jgi:hypothetical protein